MNEKSLEEKIEQAENQLCQHYIDLGKQLIELLRRETIKTDQLVDSLIELKIMRKDLEEKRGTDGR